MPPASAIKGPDLLRALSGLPFAAGDLDDDNELDCQEEIHRNQKRMRDNMETGEGGVDPGLFSPRRDPKQQAVRRLDYPDADDILGQISHLPDDNAVEQEPHMSQAWNQDQSQGGSQASTASAPSELPVINLDDELEEGELIIQSQMPIAG